MFWRLFFDLYFLSLHRILFLWSAFSDLPQVKSNGTRWPQTKTFEMLSQNKSFLQLVFVRYFISVTTKLINFRCLSKLSAVLPHQFSLYLCLFFPIFPQYAHKFTFTPSTNFQLLPIPTPTQCTQMLTIPWPTACVPQSLWKRILLQEM